MLSGAHGAAAQQAAGERPGRPPGNALRWPRPLNQPPAWFASDDAVRIADNVLLYQRSNGGWPKNIDMAAVLDETAQDKIRRSRDQADTMIDNGATWSQIRYLALVYNATHHQRFADACRRGVDYLLAAQYPNGGWPQIYPLLEDYSTHITFNDGAMVGVMRLLRDVAAGREPFAFVDAEHRAAPEGDRQRPSSHSQVPGGRRRPTYRVVRPARRGRLPAPCCTHLRAPLAQRLGERRHCRVPHGTRFAHARSETGRRGRRRLVQSSEDRGD